MRQIWKAHLLFYLHLQPKEEGNNCEHTDVPDDFRSVRLGRKSLLPEEDGVDQKRRKAASARVLNGQNSHRRIPKTRTTSLPHALLGRRSRRSSVRGRRGRDDIRRNSQQIDAFKTLHFDGPHGTRPCGSINKKSPCMGGDKCVKSFPKPFSQSTIVNDNGYPTYRRRDTGVVHRLKCGQTHFDVNNRWIVPYNPWLSLKFDSHQFRILRLNCQRQIHL